MLEIDLLVWGLYSAVLYISFFLLLVFLEKGGLKPEIEWLDEWPSVSLVIPAYNEEDTIGMTIESAADIEYPEDKYEIIVVDDGSEDRTGEIASKYENEEIITLIQQENKGKGAALNAGLKEAEGEFFGCVDADSRLSETSLKNIMSDFEEDMGGIASAMKVHEPKNLLQKVQWLEYMVGIFMRNIMGAVNAIHVTPGPLSIYRKEVLDDVGGFDNSSRVEDQEVCFRFQDNNYRVGHSRKGEVYTVAPPTVKAFFNQRYRWYRGSLETLIQYKHMFLNPKYGDFGMFSMPTKIAQGVLSILGLGLMTYYIINPLWAFAGDFAVLGFQKFAIDLSTLTVENFVSNFYWWIISQRFLSLILLGSVFLFSLFMAYLASIHTEEKLFEYGKLPPFIYFLWYVFFIGFMWLIVIIYVILGRDKKW